jgi:hypothetical protein
VTNGNGGEDVSYNVVVMKVRLTSVNVTDQVRLGVVDQVRVVVLMKLESSVVGQGTVVLMETTSWRSEAMPKLRIEAARLVIIGLLTKGRVGAIDTAEGLTTVAIGILPRILPTRVCNIGITGCAGAGIVDGLVIARGLRGLTNGDLIRDGDPLLLLV